ncbi:salt tolerance down-regulator-domain-containing protein [Phlyctochytrium arcticum]|nr:salt tolerance down-regulator-domain-containing protein [Phlyctochytrium arcticum]
MLTTRTARADIKGESYQQRMIICSKDGSKTATIMHTVNPNLPQNMIPGPPTTDSRTAVPSPHTEQAPAASAPASTTTRRKKNKKKGKGTGTHSPTHHDPHSTNGASCVHDDDEEEDEDSLYDEHAESRGRGEHRSSITSSAHHESQSPECEGHASDGSPVADPSATDSKSSKKKKKKKNQQLQHVHPHNSNVSGNHQHRRADIWYKSDAEEKQRIRAFWLQLGEEERRMLVQLEKEAVLKKMKEQQKQTCSCSVCGRKRTVIEEELEILYDAYYEELENFANDQSGKALPHGSSLPAIPPGSEADPHHLHQAVAAAHAHIIAHAVASPGRRAIIQHRHQDEEDGEYEDEEDDEEDYEHDPSESIFEFGSSLTVKGGILTVADDFLKNDGRKFLDLMEQLAERKIRQLDDELDRNGDNNGEWDEGDYDDEDYDDDEEEDTMTEEQRMEEGRRMFQIFAAKMFEQRVLQAYREKVAQERQMHLLDELEKEKEQQALRELARQKTKEKKRQQKRVQKQLKEEERLAQERKRQDEEDRVRAEKDAKAEVDRQRREAERARKDEEKARRDEEDRKRRETERARKEDEKRKQKEAEERKRREREERERIERERKEKDDRERKEKEEKERKEREERERRDREEREAKEREEKLRRDREEKDQRERDEVHLRQMQMVQQQQMQKGGRGTPTKSSIPPTSKSSSASSSARPPSNSRMPTSVRTTQPNRQQPHTSSALSPPPRTMASSMMAHPSQTLAMNAFTPGSALPPPNSSHLSVRPPPGHQLPHQPLIGMDSRPPPQPISIPQSGYPRPLHLFGQHPHVSSLHQSSHMAIPMSIGSSPPRATQLLGSNVIEHLDGSLPLPPAGLFDGSGFPALHWSATDGMAAAQLGGSLTDPSRSLLAPGNQLPPPLPIGSGTSRMDTGFLSSSAPGAPSLLGSNPKAVTRPAPIRRPSAVAPPTPAGDRSPLQSFFSTDDDEPVAGSAVLGGELLKDDERIGGGSSWRYMGGAGQIPSTIGPPGVSPAIVGSGPTSGDIDLPFGSQAWSTGGRFF